MPDPVEDILACAVRGLVDAPERVAVHAPDPPESGVYEVVVADEDLGKVIGRQGRVAAALRMLARAAGLKQHRRVQVEFASETEVTGAD